MASIISFNEAISETNDQDRSLLIGNGFSAQHFSYQNLLEKTDIDPSEPIYKLFKETGGYDFEAVIHALSEASKVARIYGHSDNSDAFTKDANRVREQLVHAIREIHPEHKQNIVPHISSAMLFLSNFIQFFSLNYDLLLYWIQLEKGHFSDGFGLGEERGGIRGPFKSEAYCNTFYIHGCLHLFLDQEKMLYKAVKSQNGTIDSISNRIVEKKQLPLYVAEGTSVAKISKINSVPYLRYCLDKLHSINGYIFIYGHSAKDNDTHIYDAIFRSNASGVFFSVYDTSEDSISQFDAQLSRFQKLGKKGIPYKLYDAKSACVWDTGSGA